MTETSRKNREKTPSRVKNTLASFLLITIYRKKIKSLANNIFENQNSPKIKIQERRPGKGRRGGDRAAFATPSLSPLHRKELLNEKIKSSRT